MSAGTPLARRALLGGLLGATWLLSGGHTPYKQWVVYRKRTLVVGSVRADPPSYALAQRVAAVLLRALPASRARPGRAPTYPRLAGLLATDQLDVAVVERAAAAAMLTGAAPFETVGPAPLQTLYDLDSHLLVSNGRFPDRHAWLVSSTLHEHGEAGLGGLPAADAAIPLHPGTRTFAAGGPEPEPPPAPE